MLTGHGSAVVGWGAGGQRPITPSGYGTAAAAGFFGSSSPSLGPSSRGLGAGGRPGTSGGMFAAAAATAGLGGGRGGLGSGVGGMRMGGRGVAGLGSPGGHGMMSL